MTPSVTKAAPTALPLPGCKSGKPTARRTPSSLAVVWNWRSASPSIQLFDDAKRRTPAGGTMEFWNDGMVVFIKVKRCEVVERSARLGTCVSGKLLDGCTSGSLAPTDARSETCAPFSAVLITPHSHSALRI